MDNFAFFEWPQQEHRRLLTAMIMPEDARRLSELRGAFGAILSNRPIFPFNMARTGLATALRIFQRSRPQSNEVIVPAFICPSVIAAIQATGLRAVPADIRPDLTLDPDTLEELISPRTLAVLAAHMYGCPAPIREIEAICQRHGIFLVDDSAQVAGVSVDGRPLGTFGDIGIISFSQSKTIVAGCHNAGGLLIVNNRELEPLVADAYAALPGPRACIPDFLTFAWNFILTRWTEMPSYYFFRIFRPLAEPRAPIFEPATKINRVVTVLALEQLKSLQIRLAGRRRIAELFHRSIVTQRTVGFPQFAPGRYLTRIMLTLPPGADLTEIRGDLRRKGIRTRIGYPIFTSESAAPPERALSLQPRLIELPSSSAMSAETVDRICGAFSASMARSTTNVPITVILGRDQTFSAQ